MSRQRQPKIGSKPSPSTTIHAKLNATDLQGEGTDNRHWMDYPLIVEKSGDYGLTDYGKLISVIITPDSMDRVSNEYLPVPDSEDEVYCIPDEEQLLTACYACAFGQPSKSHQQIFEDAYIARMQ